MHGDNDHSREKQETMRGDLEPPSLGDQGGFTNKVNSNWNLTLKWLVDGTELFGVLDNKGISL